jgi:hypothetical protein
VSQTTTTLGLEKLVKNSDHHQPNLPIRTPNNQPKPLQTIKNQFLSSNQATALHGSLSLSNKDQNFGTQTEYYLIAKDMMPCVHKPSRAFRPCDSFLNAEGAMVCATEIELYGVLKGVSGSGPWLDLAFSTLLSALLRQMNFSAIGMETDSDLKAVGMETE